MSPEKMAKSEKQLMMIKTEEDDGKKEEAEEGGEKDIFCVVSSSNKEYVTWHRGLGLNWWPNGPKNYAQNYA